MSFDENKLYLLGVYNGTTTTTIHIPATHAISDGAPVVGYGIQKLCDLISEDKDVSTVRVTCDSNSVFSQENMLYKLIQELRKLGEYTFELDAADSLDDIILDAQKGTCRVILLTCFDTVTTEFGAHTYTRKQVHARSAELGYDYVFIASI